MAGVRRPAMSKAEAGAEDARAEAELRMRLALAAAQIGVWEYDVAADRLTWDERVREVAEVEADFEPTWQTGFLAAVHPEDRDAVTEAFLKLRDDGDGARLAVECRVIGRRTGRETWAALHGQCLPAKGGGLRVIGTARDVTHQKRAAAALSSAKTDLEQRVAEAVAERQLWADMFEGSDNPIAAVDKDLRLIALNGAYRAACQRLFGVTLEVGTLLPEALAHMPAARDVTVSIWRRALAGESVDIPRSQEAAPAANWFEIALRPLYGRDGALIGAFQQSRNITTRVRAQERLREAQSALQRAQKMEALGQLTGGVAHDFNNLLQVVSGNLQLLMGDVAGNEDGERRVKNALAGVARGAKLAAQLLAFGRRQPLEPKVISVSRFIRGLDDLLRRALGGEIELETVVSGGLWNTLVDPGQLENAVLNLAINARDAMDGQGRLTLEAGNAFLDDDYARQHEDIKAGQYVMIAVTDTGCGMSPEIVERVFEPFFSTKAEGKGTGLGLSMVYGLVKQSAGHIKIYSEAGQGSTIKLYLPRALGAEEVVTETKPGPVEGGKETILVVEDDDEVRETVVAMLTELGYEVRTAREAEGALRQIADGEAVDLLFTDVVMPGPLRSPDLARRAQELAPGLAVLFTSGYTENAIVHGGRLDQGVDLLSKPYSREALALKIRAVLQGRSQASPAKNESLAATGEPRVDPDLVVTRSAVTILLVEDDELIRMSTAAMLEDLGHQVIEAADAEGALDLMAARPIDVLITDRGLPGMSGDELAKAAANRQSDIGIIFATGAGAIAADTEHPGAVLVVKPYSASDLQTAVLAATRRP